MHQYELMVILDPEIDERTVAPSLDKFLNVIRNDGGTVDKVDIWGRRRLAYEINKKTEGIYAVVSLTSTGDATKELDRQLKLSEAVMRTKVLRAEEAIAQVAEAAKLLRREGRPQGCAPRRRPPRRRQVRRREGRRSRPRPRLPLEGGQARRSRRHGAASAAAPSAE